MPRTKKKDHIVKICKYCKKSKSMHKSRVTCSTYCAKKYSAMRHKLYRSIKK